jgi:nitrate reductase cytochrome c-type subunit
MRRPSATHLVPFARCRSAKASEPVKKSPVASAFRRISPIRLKPDPTYESSFFTGSSRYMNVKNALAVVALALALCAAAACGGPPAPAVARSTAERANGRAYDGAPPTIPHDAAIGACVTCHDSDGTVIDGVGVAPASPHGDDAAAGNMRRCRQCHVPTEAHPSFVASGFTGLPQGPWLGRRATPGAPPTIPHTLQLREHCAACHSGLAVRAEIRTTHPERTRCRQCHVPDASPLS